MTRTAGFPRARRAPQTLYVPALNQLIHVRSIYCTWLTSNDLLRLSERLHLSLSAPTRMAQTFWCGITPEMDTAPNTIECWNLRDETPMNVLIGTHPSPKDGLPDRATPDCGKKCTSHSSYTSGLPNLLNDPLHRISCSCWPAPKDWAKSQTRHCRCGYPT